MPDTETPLHGLAAMNQTQELRTHLPPWKRVRLWALGAFGLLLLLWEADSQYGGVVFAWLGVLLDWTMDHAVFPGAIGVLLGHYCWPQTVRLMPGKMGKRSSEQDSR